MSYERFPTKIEHFMSIIFLVKPFSEKHPEASYINASKQKCVVEKEKHAIEFYSVLEKVYKIYVIENNFY